MCANPWLPVLCPLKRPEGSVRPPRPPLRLPSAHADKVCGERYGSTPAFWVRRDNCSWSHRACRWRSAGVQTDRGTGQWGLRRGGVGGNKGGASGPCLWCARHPFLRLLPSSYDEAAAVPTSGEETGTASQTRPRAGTGEEAADEPGPRLGAPEGAGTAGAPPPGHRATCHRQEGPGHGPSTGPTCLSPGDRPHAGAQPQLDDPLHGADSPLGHMQTGQESDASALTFTLTFSFSLFLLPLTRYRHEALGLQALWPGLGLQARSITPGSSHRGPIPGQLHHKGNQPATVPGVAPRGVLPLPADGAPSCSHIPQADPFLVTSADLSLCI